MDRMVRSVKVLLGAVSVLLAASAGCAGSGQSSGDGADQTDPSKSTGEQSSAVPTSSGSPAGQCALLDPMTVQDLAGEHLDGREATVAGSNLSSCEYGRLDDVGVRVAQVPANEWARALPGIVDQFKAMGALDDPNLRRQLEDGKDLIERGETIPPDQACALFSDMLRLQGVPAGGDWIITYIPGRENPQAASVQACVDGTYTSIVVGKPDLAVSREQETALEEALATIS